MPITLERTPEEKQIYAKVLLDNGASVRAVARRCHMGFETVQAIKRETDYSPSMLEKIKQRMPYRYARLVDDTLDLMDRNEIKKAPIQTRMWIAGVATDKMQSLEGSNRPVFNVINVVQNLEKRMSDLDTQQAALLALKTNAL